MTTNIKIKSVIYQIRNLINNKVYVGSTNYFPTRRSRHFKQLEYNKHHNQHLQHSFNKYGKENFIFEILEYVEDVDNLAEREQYWMDKLNVRNDEKGYNIYPYARSSHGKEVSEETKKKLSKAHKGKKLSEETKRKIGEYNKGKKAGSKHPLYGKHRTDEEKKKISKATTGKKNHNYGKRGEQSPASKLEDSKVIEIKNVLNEGKLSQRQIAKLFKIGVATVSYINTGVTWSHIDGNENYTKKDVYKLSEKDIIEIKKLLATSNLTQAEIGVLFHVAGATISSIKSGKQWGHIQLEDISNEEIQKIKPHRNKKLIKKDVIEIKKLLLQGLKLKEIALKFDVSSNTISDIKDKRIWSYIYLEDYIDENELQLLRSLNKKNKKLSDNEVIEIKEMLQKRIKQKDIADKFNVKIKIISDIKNEKIYSHIKINRIINDIVKFKRPNHIGENNPDVKLTEKQIIEIKKLLIINTSQNEIAKKYNISQTAVSKIKLGRTWSHIKLEDYLDENGNFKEVI